MPDEMNLRKQRVGTETEASNHPRAAGQVLNERSIRAEGFFGGERVYDLSGSSNGPPPNVPVLGSDRDDRGRKRKVGDLDVSMDPDALARDDKMSKEELRRRFEAESVQQNRGGWQGADSEDLSGVFAEESAKRQKREADRQKRGGGGGGRGRGR
ncbi:uncharacterized protein RCC_05881 [Ramularia collo-cygni]|uniref:Uncharacterized protein n=1 Tax=Ramularia collo-cygni TaxID=112498 RepID=A0A2D3VBE4_9PEZI|nr:uncharacterized protein RCC_05881 [Ramularia collo-cygni]CZT20024.1 uncharacterized protein RCC_05881 [Ramularia collo-cygni]